MVSWDEFTALYDAASRLERERDYASAHDAFLVVGDAAEERGDMGEARDARRRAMVNRVTAWAVRRWPDEEIYIDDVRFSQFPYGTFGGRRSRVDMQIRHRYQYPRTVTHVTVGRRGDIRIEREKAS